MPVREKHTSACLRCTVWGAGLYSVANTTIARGAPPARVQVLQRGRGGTVHVVLDRFELRRRREGAQIVTLPVLEDVGRGQRVEEEAAGGDARLDAPQSLHGEVLEAGNGAVDVGEGFGQLLPQVGGGDVEGAIRNS